MMNKRIKFTVALCCCLASFVQAQTTQITGKVPSIKDNKFTIGYFVGSNHITDTIRPKGGQFTWNANLKDPQLINLITDDKFYSFFVEPGKMNLTEDKDKNLNFKGSKSQDEYEAFLKSFQDLDDKQSSLFKNWKKGTDQQQAALEAQVDELRAQRLVRTDQYIADHPKSPVSMSQIYKRSHFEEYGKIKTLFEMLDSSLRESDAGNRIVERLNLLKRSVIGSKILEFTLNDENGKAINFSDFKGKFVLVDFWASWCGPCRAENPNLLKAYNAYKDRNFTIIGISLDQNADKWKKAITEDQMPWTQLSDLKGFDNQLSAYYGIRAIPRNLLIDPHGKIVAKDLRGEELGKKLTELLK